MTFPVMVHRLNGQFEASLVGAPELRVTAATPTLPQICEAAYRDRNADSRE
jgi:hypothetical protein